MTTSQGLLGVSGTGGPTLATGVLDHVSLRGGRSVAAGGGTRSGAAPMPRPRSRAAGITGPHGTFTVTGSATSRRTRPAARAPASPHFTPVGAFAGLIAVVVVGTMFITADTGAA